VDSAIFKIIGTGKSGYTTHGVSEAWRQPTCVTLVAQIKSLSPTFATAAVLKKYFSFIGARPTEIIEARI